MGQDVFAERLARLDGAHAQRTAQRTAVTTAARGRTPDWVRNMAYPGSMVAACVIGVLTVILSRYVMFHVNGIPDPDADADMTMLMDGGLALGIAFVLRSALNMTSREHLACKSVGIWIALTCMHNAVHAYPSVWAAGFSQEWVDRTTTMTQPRSFYFNGMRFEIAGDSAPDDAAEYGPAAKPDIKINRF